MPNDYSKVVIGGIQIPCTDDDAQAKILALNQSKGAANGIATLDNSGKVPSSQLPSYVDDVVELLDISATAPAECAEGDKYHNTTSGKIFTATAANTWGSTGADPEKGKIYTNLSNNKSYRWGGSAYTEISSSDVTGITIGSGGTNYTPSQGVITIPAYEAGAQVNVKPDWNAASGSTSEILNKPTIPSAQVQTDWNATSGMGVLLNKPSSESASQGGTTESLVTTGEKYTWNSKQDALAFINNDYNASTNKVATQNDLANGNTAYTEAVTFGTGINGSATSVVSVPVDKSLCIVTIADGQTAQSFSLVSAPNAGRTIHVIVDNSGNTSDLTVTVPHGTTDGINYVNTNDLASGSMDVAAGKIGEINIVYASSKAWVRYIGA